MIRLVLTTFADEPSARACVRQLVEEKLAACGTLLPGARSIFSWEGHLVEESETAVLFKLPVSAYETFAARLLAIHPYETPELLAWDCDAASKPYEDWANAAVGCSRQREL